MYHSLSAAETEVSLDHISHLQEALAQILNEAYPEDNISQLIVDHFNPVDMREEMLELFTPEAFLTMFQTELGKGVILGAFVQRYIFGEEQEEGDENAI